MHHLLFLQKQRNSMTPSKRPKTPLSGHPKFKNLRKRLQYKKTKERTPLIEELVPPVLEQPDAVQDKVARPEDQTCVDEDELLHENSKKMRKKQNYFNRASPMKVVRLYKSMNESHRKVISDNLFASFLGIKCSKLQPELCNFLMASFNYKTCQLEFPGRGSIPIDEKAVQEVLGCPRGRFPVVYQLIAEATDFVMEVFGFGSGKQPKLTEIEDKLVSMKEGDDNYFSLWVLYVGSSILAPTTGVRVSPKFYPAIMDPSKIKDLNWPRFVITILIEAAKEKGKKNAFKACMLFMMVKYIDSLETTNITVGNDVARICAWDNKSIASAIDQDTNADGTFGRLPLKKCFREKKVCMISTPDKIKKFVKANLPPNYSEEELERYTKAAHEMYSEIDVAVASFISKVSTNSKPSQEVKHKPFAKPTESVSNMRYREKQFQLQDSWNEDASESDTDYMCTDGGYTSENEDTSLDDESFSCNEVEDSSSDDDFMSVHKKRKVCKPFLRERRRVLRTKKPQNIEKGAEKGLHADEAPVQMSHPEDVTANEAASDLLANQSSPGLPVQTSCQEVLRDVDDCVKVVLPVVAPIQEVRPDQYGTDHHAAHVGTNQSSSDFPAKRRKVDCVNGSSEAVLIKKASSVLVVEKTHLDTLAEVDCQPLLSATQIGTIYVEENHNSEVPVQSKESIDDASDIKVVHDALQQLQQYESGSQSSNDVFIVDIHSAPSTAFSRTQPQVRTPCFNHEDGTSVHAIMDITASSAVNTVSDARNMQNKFQGSEALKSEVPLTSKKAVRWADQSPSSYVGTIKQQDAIAGSNVNPLIQFDPLRKEPVSSQGPQTCARRPITRSMSPMKASSSSLMPNNEEILACQKHIQNVSVGSIKESNITACVGKLEGPISELVKEEQTVAEITMNKKLDFESVAHDDPRRRWLPGEAPSFDLGFDDIDGTEPVTFNVESKTALPVITSSNEDQFYGPAEEYEKLANQLGEAYFPNEGCTSKISNKSFSANAQIQFTTAQQTPVKKGDSKEVTEIIDLDNPQSKTPVPQAHQKRLLRAGKAQQSPFVQYEKKNSVAVQKDDVDVYNALCQHGVKSESNLKNHMIIDYGSNFIFTPDLADSVALGGWLSNSTCEIALHVLSKELAPQKKLIMSLNVSNKLRERAFNSREIKKTFKFSDMNRLDHKEQVMFPVLQNLSSVRGVFCGHYYLVNLNLKAERFEVMDSMRKESDKQYREDSTNIIASIKYLWETNYKQSNIKIQDFGTKYIPCPKQQTTYDCGYCMLKNMEGWDGRRMAPFDTNDMRNYRILYTKKWLDWSENKILWRNLLFRN